MVLLSLALCGVLSAWLKLAYAGTVGSRPMDVHDGPSSQQMSVWQTEDQGSSPSLLIDRLREMWEAQQAHVELPQNLVNIRVHITQPDWKPVSDRGQIVLPGKEARMTIQMISMNRELAQRQAMDSALQQTAYYGFRFSVPMAPQYSKLYSLLLGTQEEFALADMHGFGISQALKAMKLNWRRRIFFNQHVDGVVGLANWLKVDIRRYPQNHPYRPYRGKVVLRLETFSHYIYIVPDFERQFSNIYAVPMLITKSREWEMMKPPKWLERAESRAAAQS